MIILMKNLMWEVFIIDDDYNFIIKILIIMLLLKL